MSNRDMRTLSWMLCRDCGSRMFEIDWGYDCSRCDTVLKWDKGIPLRVGERNED